MVEVIFDIEISCEIKCKYMHGYQATLGSNGTGEDYEQSDAKIFAYLVKMLDACR